MALVFNEGSDLWWHTSVTLPARSRLSHLEPVGVSTGFVESLTSYSARLAAVHNVTHASLFGYEISPLIDRKYLRNSESKLDRGALLAASFRTLVRAINGTGVTARDYTSALEQLTGRNNLCCLTMTIWANVLPHRNLMRPYKAWCPSCYEEFKHKEMPVFDPLLWSLSVIATCAKHHLRLRSRCPQCDRTIPHLDSHSKPGFCSKCNHWLGRSPLRYYQATDDILSEELERQAWITEQLCTLLAYAPRIENPPKKEAVTKSIKFCIRNIAGMTESRFARAIGVPQSTVSDWQRQCNVPELEKLLRIAYFTQVPLLNILMGHDCNQHTATGAAGSICKQQHKDPRPHKRRTRIDIEKVRTGLEAALSIEITPSLQEVARSLGYSSTALVKHFPVECKKLSEKYKQWRKAEWVKVAVELERVLIRNPPQSIRAIAKALDRSYTSLYQNLPDLCRRIVQRYELYRRACRKQKKENFRREIREIVIALHLGGIYPSVKRVEARLHQRKTIRHSKMALDTLCQVRAECGIPSAPNNFVRFAIT